jgi:hypothetical protein
MVARVHLTQSFRADVGIDLRCDDVRMAKQRLHHTQVGAALE